MALRASITLLFLACGALSAQAQAPRSLKDLAQSSFLIGAALNRDQIEGRDAAAREILERHFTTITPENVLKWEVVHPEPDRFDFDAADKLVALGAERGLFVVGHTLVWHQQTPRWVAQGADGGPVDRETLLARLRAHIETVVGRYRGRIHGWDVVNEAFEDDGGWRQSFWYRTLGEDYVAKAFEYARAADPQAQLYYNDYNLWKPAKRAAVRRLVASLRERGLRVDGVGEQGHWLLAEPSSAEIDATIADLATLGVRVMITELDVDPLPRPEGLIGADVSKRAELRATLDPYATGLPAAVERQITERWAQIFTVFLRHRPALDRVTFWGVTNRTSWLNNWPVRGRTNYPLLWNREGRGTPALDAVVEVLSRAR